MFRIRNLTMGKISPSHLSSKGYRLLMLALLVVLSGTLFSLKLSFDGYWLDELITVCRTQIPWKIHYHIWPPFYFWLIWLWARIFGVSEVALRSYSVLWGILGVLATFYLGSLISQRLGFFAALLLIFSHTMIRYSQEARAYTMVLTISILSLIFLVRIMEGRATRREWILLGLTNILGTITHYNFVIFMVSEYAAFLLIAFLCREEPMERKLRDIFKSLALWTGFFIPYFAVVHNNILHNSPYPGSRKFHEIYGLIFYHSGIQKISFLFLGTISWFLAYFDTRWRRFLFLFTAVILVFLLCMEMISILTHPVWKTRYLLPILPLICLIVSYPLTKFSLFKVGLLITCFLCFFMGRDLAKHYYGHHHKRGWREAASWIEENYNGELLVAEHLKRYQCYYLDRCKRDMRCISLKEFKEKLKGHNNHNFSSAGGIWFLIPGGKEKKVKIRDAEALLESRGFQRDRCIVVGRKSKIIHFARKED